jgi:hypothetical protein
MAKRKTVEETWGRPLSLESFVAMGILAFGLLGRHGARVGIEVALADGTSYEAHSMDELFDDVKNVRDDFVSEVSLQAIAGEKVAVFLRSYRVASGQTTVRTFGSDETLVLGIHAQVVNALNEAFKEEDDARREADKVIDPVPGSGGINIGAIHGGTVALAGSGEATASSGSLPSEKPRHWWKQTWVLLGAPLVVAVVAGVVVALIVGH